MNFTVFKLKNSIRNQLKSSKTFWISYNLDFKKREK